MRTSLTIAWVSVALFAACSKSGDPPSGFGVNVTVDARAVAPETRAMAKQGRLVATFSAGPTSAPQVFAIQPAFGSGELRFHFVPTVTMGSVTLDFDALTDTGVVVAWGRGVAVALDPTKAVASTITLAAGVRPAEPDGGAMDAPVVIPGDGGKKGAGSTCTVATAAECESGICVDGVCCKTECSGVCESCAVRGMEGTCSPVPDNTDPDKECVPVPPPPPPDAGADDGGAAAPPAGDGGLKITVPDAGLRDDPMLCAGVCNGARACRFPGAEKSCGNKWCNSRTAVGGLACDGKGGCEPKVDECTAYACGGDGVCKTICSAHTDCQEGYYCNANNQCAPKKGDSLQCNTLNECQSGHCSGGVCCNTSCESPLNCTEDPGKCKCPGVTCPAGVACQVYYRDADGDGAGDMFGTLANGGAKAACKGSVPVGFVEKADDCDDGDANAKPGQTAYFGVPSKTKGTYDYNCDGMMQKEFPEALGSVCKFCTLDRGFIGCGTPASTCASAGATAGLGCGIPPCTGRLCYFGCAAFDGFIAAVNCGTQGDWKVCGTCKAVGEGPSSPYMFKKVQTCH